MIVEETRTPEQPASSLLRTHNKYLVGGREASVTLVKYGETRWETSVFAYDGRMSYYVELAAKLEGADLDFLWGFVRDLVESG